MRTICIHKKYVNKKHLLKVCYVLFVGIVDCVPVEVHIEMGMGWYLLDHWHIMYSFIRLLKWKSWNHWSWSCDDWKIFQNLLLMTLHTWKSEKRRCGILMVCTCRLPSTTVMFLCLENMSNVFYTKHDKYSIILLFYLII